MRWGVERAALVLAGVLTLGLGAGCASDCETVCGKLDFCELLVNRTVFQCVDQCEEREDVVGEGTVQSCADCVDDRSCSSIGRRQCANACAPVLGADDGGEGGSAGEGGGAGEEGDAGEGGAGGAIIQVGG